MENGGQFSGTILQTLNKHSSDINSCDFAPNYTLVTCSGDKTVRIWDWKAGEGYVERSTVSPLCGHKYGVTCARVSPQGSMLATTSIDGTAILWNLHTGARIHTIVQVNGDAIRCCRFSPDSTVLVTAGDNGAICVWDLIHKSLIRTIFRHEGATNCLAFTPDSQYLISACSLEVVNVWCMKEILDTTDENPLVPLTSKDNTHDLGVISGDFSNVIRSSDEDPLTKYYTFASSGNDHAIKLWTLTAKTFPKHENTKVQLTMELTNSLCGHHSAVTCVRFSNNGLYLVSSSLDKRIKIWNANGYCLNTFEGHSRYVNCVAINKDMEIIASGSAGSNDKSVLIWSLSEKVTLNSQLLRSASMLLGNSAFSVQGYQEMRVVSNPDNEENQVTLIEKFDEICEGSINTCAIYANNLLAVGSSDKLLRVFKLFEENNNIEEVSYSPLEGHLYSINHVEFSRDGATIVTCSMDGSTIFWDTETGDKIKSIPESNLALRVCKFSPDNRFIVTAGDDEVAAVWDVQTLNRVMIYEEHSDAITSACFSPDGKIIATTSNSHDFRLWNLLSNASFHTTEEAHDLGVQSCDFSPNLEPIPNQYSKICTDYLLATSGNDAMVRLWKISIPEKGCDLVYEECEVKLWRLLQGHGGNVNYVSFSPNTGEMVCSVATDKQARIWSVYSAECLHVLEHSSIVTTCSFSLDCSTLAVGCLDKTLWLWKLPQQLVFQVVVANKIKCRTKAVVDWNPKDVTKWMKNIGLAEIGDVASSTTLDGQKLLTLTPDEICTGLNLDESAGQKLKQEIKWLKCGELNQKPSANFTEIPHEFLCPITHEVMRDPVTCADGFTYEKRAISEWFMSGKFTSPMTNAVLKNTEYFNNQELRNAIYRFLYKEE